MDNVIQQVISGLEGIAVTAILAVLGVVIKGAGDIVVELLSVKKDEVIAKIGAERYNFYRSVAIDVYNRVEEEFRGQSGAYKQKIKSFDKYMMERIPNLKEEDLAHFRQSVVGNINNEIKGSKLSDEAKLK